MYASIDGSRGSPSSSSTSASASSRSFFSASVLSDLFDDDEEEDGLTSLSRSGATSNIRSLHARADARVLTFFSFFSCFSVSRFFSAVVGIGRGLGLGLCFGPGGGGDGLRGVGGVGGGRSCCSCCTDLVWSCDVRGDDGGRSLDGGALV